MPVISNVRRQLQPSHLFRGPKAKLLFLAAAVELPFATVLYFTKSEHSALAAAIQLFHFIPLVLLSLPWLFLFGHGAPTSGSLELWHLIYFVGVYIGQVILIALLLWVALRGVSLVRGRRVPPTN